MLIQSFLRSKGISRLSDSGILVFSYQTAWNSRDLLQPEDTDVEVVLSRFLQQNLGEQSTLVKDIVLLVQRHVAMQHILSFKQRLRQREPGPGYTFNPATNHM